MKKCQTRVEKVTNFGSKKVTELNEKSNSVTAESNRVRLTAKQRKVLEFCEEMPHTAQEILEMLGVKNKIKRVSNILQNWF